ncbi:MAG: hypothetical protein ABI650_04160, partial [Dokdonella sp.]
HNPTGTRVDPVEDSQCAVKGKYLDSLVVAVPVAIIKGNQQRTATAFVCASATRMIDQQLAHCARCKCHEMLATFERQSGCSAQFQPGFIHQRCGRQGSIRAAELLMRAAAKFVVEQSENPVGRHRVATSGGINKCGEVFFHATGHALDKRT